MLIDHIDYTALPYAEYTTQAGHLVLLDRKNRPLKRQLPDGFIIDYATTCPINLEGDIIVERRWFDLGSLSMTRETVDRCRWLLKIWPDENIEYKLVRNDCRYRLEEDAIYNGNIKQYRAATRGSVDSETSSDNPPANKRTTPRALAREKWNFDRLLKRDTPYRIYR